jgi:hypothetical protein
MNSQPGQGPTQRTTIDLRAECIKVAGRRDVFVVRLIDYTDNELVLLSQKPVGPGTNLVLRLIDLPSFDVQADGVCLRMHGLTEVCWEQEITEEYEVVYEMGVRYVDVY